MKNLFGINSKFIEFMNTLADVAVLNFCFLIGCIPILTVGTSTIAAFSVALKIYDSRDNHVFRQFRKAYAGNLKNGITLTVFGGFVIYCLWMDLQLFEAVEGNPIYFLIIGFTLLGIFLLHFIYIFPLEARYDSGLFTNLRNARKIGIRFFTKTLLILVLWFAEIFLFYGINDVLFVIGCVVGPMTLIMTDAGIVLPVVKELEREQKAGEDGEDFSASPEN
ncbi:MAG: DUF624 domain-containing protein [Lachnospiraceae bacterium]|nr:DUF624 domain-containing protein [Lachnospiraceae bacterium]